MLTHTSIYLNNLRRYNKSVVDCKNATAINNRKLIKDEEFGRALTRDDIGSKEGCGTLNVKYVPKVLRKKSIFAEKIILRSVQVV